MSRCETYAWWSLGLGIVFLFLFFHHTIEDGVILPLTEPQMIGVLVLFLLVVAAFDLVFRLIVGGMALARGGTVGTDERDLDIAQRAVADRNKVPLVWLGAYIGYLYFAETTPGRAAVISPWDPSAPESVVFVLFLMVLVMSIVQAASTVVRYRVSAV